MYPKKMDVLYSGKFSQGSIFAGGQSFTIFMGLIFIDARTHIHYVLHDQAYFLGLIFAVR